MPRGGYDENYCSEGCFKMANPEVVEVIHCENYEEPQEPFDRKCDACGAEYYQATGHICIAPREIDDFEKGEIPQTPTEVMLEVAAREIFALHPDVPCWVPPSEYETFTKMFAYICRLGFEKGYKAAVITPTSKKDICPIDNCGKPRPTDVPGPPDLPGQYYCVNHRHHVKKTTF